MKTENKDETSSTTSVASTVKEESEPPQESSSSSVVTSLAPNDVLMGRGAAVIGNEGNRRFRKLIQKYKVEYDATRIRQEKDRIARKIVEAITSRQGRFLKKIDTPAAQDAFQVPSGKSAWMVVKQAVVLQKVKQAFRDDRRSFDEDRSNGSKPGVPEGIPAMLRPSLGGLKSPYGADPSIGAASLAGNPSMVNPALLMQANVATLGNAGLLQLQQQQLIKSQLDSQMLSQLLAARQTQLASPVDPLAALRQQAIMDENRRVMLLRQVLALRNGPASMVPSAPAAGQQTGAALAAMNRQATLREQLAAMGGAAALGSSASSQLPNAFLR